MQVRASKGMGNGPERARKRPRKASKRACEGRKGLFLLGFPKVMKEAVKASMSAAAPMRLKDLGLLQERALESAKGLQTIVVKADGKARSGRATMLCDAMLYILHN